MRLGRSDDIRKPPPPPPSFLSCRVAAPRVEDLAAAECCDDGPTRTLPRPAVGTSRRTYIRCLSVARDFYRVQKRLVVPRTRRLINVSRSTKQTGAVVWTAYVHRFEIKYHSVVILAGFLNRIVWAALNVERKSEGMILSQRWKMSRCLKGRGMTNFNGCCVSKQRRISVHFNCKTGLVSFFSLSFHDLHNFRRRYLRKKDEQKEKIYYD